MSTSDLSFIIHPARICTAEIYLPCSSYVSCVWRKELTGVHTLTARLGHLLNWHQIQSGKVYVIQMGYTHRGLGTDPYLRGPTCEIVQISP